VERAVKRLAERAGIKEDQVASVIEKIKTKLQEIGKIRESGLGELKELLGEEAFKKIERDLGRILNGQGGRDQGGPGGGPGGFYTRLWDRIKQELQLTDEQVEKIKLLSDELNEKTGKLFEEARSKGRDGFRQAFEESRKLTDEFVTKAKEHLTDEQKTKLDDLIKQDAGAHARPRRRPGRRAGPRPTVRSRRRGDERRRRGRATSRSGGSR
jgi:hypothetical protein